MAYVVILLVTAVFIAFFSLLGLWYFGLLPLAFLIFFFSQGFNDFKLEISQNFVAERYWLYILWLLVFFGLFWILSFLGYDSSTTLLLLTLLSLFLWWISYFIPYEDGKTLFMHGFFFLGVISWANHLFTIGGDGFFKAVGHTIFLWAVGFWIVYYGLGYFTQIEKKHYYNFIYFTLLFGLFLILKIDDNLLVMLNIDLLVYAGVLALITYAPQFASLTPMRQKQLSLRRLLAGEKMLTPTKVDPFWKLKTFFLELSETPKYLAYGLEYLNVILLIWLLASYLVPLFQGQLVGQLRYWTGIFLFLFNTFFLKKNQIFTLVSRFATVLIINFSLYISLMLATNGAESMISRLIARNIFCGLLILYTTSPGIKKYLKKADLIFWLLTSLVAMLLNIVLLLRLEISGQLVFSLIFFYLGVQGTISYYALWVIRSFDQPLLWGDKKSDPLDALLDKEMSSLL